ncbi:MAG: CAP domain-containing protein [Clostridiales bacterium]|jgi:uncharacterized protein YkwD|nr:CAP domain-containing protein [Clostridiales bacterium]
MKSALSLFFYLIMLIMIFGASASRTAFAANPTATPTMSEITIDGQAISFEAYNINDYNYFKLRDLAYALNGTQKPFSVGWNESARTIAIFTKEHYIPQGGELAFNPKPLARIAEPSNHRLLIDGIFDTCAAYTIDELNYFKLRDIGEKINFSIEWDEKSNSIAIDTSSGYVAPAPTPTSIPRPSSSPSPIATSSPAPTPTVTPVPSDTLAGIVLGESISKAELVLGRPYKISAGGMEYRYYGSSGHFAMLGASNGTVRYVYTNYGFDGSGTQYLDSDGSEYACEIGSPANESDAKAMEDAIFEITNAFRGFHGLSSLIYNDSLQRASRLHSEDQIYNDYLSHESLDGRTFIDRAAEQGYYGWSGIGENIAMQLYLTGANFVDSWIQSPGHRSNILGSFNELGIGFAAGEGSSIATQLFGSRHEPGKD